MRIQKFLLMTIFFQHYTKIAIEQKKTEYDMPKYTTFKDTFAVIKKSENTLW